MDMNALILLLVFIRSVASSSILTTSRAKIIGQSSFIAPVDDHLITSVNNTRSLLFCAALCDQHIICRTADYNRTTGVCRLFETVYTVGTLQADPTTSVIGMNYCINGQQMEPDRICTRSGIYTVQAMFDGLAAAPNITLALADRGAYANMQGVYTGSSSGELAFFTYSGNKTILTKLSSEITNINAATRNGLGIVQYYNKTATIYENRGSPSQPVLYPTLNISLPATPYACVITSQYIYITYGLSYTLMTIHNFSTGVVLFIVSNNVTQTYRPAITQWKNSVFVLDQYVGTEYSLTGVYKGNWSYFSGPQLSNRHYLQYDYAGRRYLCNSAGPNPGIYGFSSNGTQLGRGPTTCSRAFQVYITKEQAIFVNIPSTGTMNVINF